MQLLVSVADASEALDALAGGADIIDAKDPTRGALGPVDPDTLSAILAVVAGRRPVSAAIGDSIGAVNQSLRSSAACPDGRPHLGSSSPHLTFVKVVSERVGAIVAEYRPTNVVVAMSADVASDAHREAMIAEARDSGARGVLLDTLNKEGPALFDVLSEHTVARWVARAREAGLMTALAGRLSAEDLARAAALGADVVGVRGAACEGGRRGRVSVAKVRALVTTLRETAPRPDFRATARTPHQSLPST